MATGIENTTLALQHYYDVKHKIFRHPLAEVYSATEQPFNGACEVWVLETLQSFGCSKEVVERLETLFLGSRQIKSSVARRVLDLGSLGEAGRFLVCEAVEGLTLGEYLNHHGALEPWQTFRIIEQLAQLIIEAHGLGLRYLAISSQAVRVVDVQRMQIKLDPLGLGLKRKEILASAEAIPTASLARHIPPWEFRRAKERTFEEITNERMEESLEEEELNSSSLLEQENLGDEQDSSEKKAVSVQDLSPNAYTLEETEDGELCADFYALAAVAYECLSTKHPYFLENRDLSDAVLSMWEEKPPSLFEQGYSAEDLSQCVISRLLAPKKGEIADFVKAFSATLSTSDREKVQAAANLLTAAPELKAAKSRKQRKTQPLIKSLLSNKWLLLLLAIILVLLTYTVASFKRPMDLFSLPEIVPYTNEAGSSDVVLVPAKKYLPHEEKPRVYLAASNGELMELGSLPFVLRKQVRGTKLNFVIVDANGNSRQVPVLVDESENGLMIVDVLE